MHIPGYLRIPIYVFVLMTALLGSFFLLPARVRYHVRESYTFSGPEADVPVALGVMVPRSGPYQTVSAAALTWDGEVERQTEAALELLLLSGVLDPDGQQTAIIAYDVTLRQGRHQWEAPVQPAHTEPQPHIESTAPALQEQAAHLADGGGTPTALQIHRFAARHLAWPEGTRSDVQPSALEAYRSGVGGCDEFAKLMVALCRAADIPAVTISGLAFPPMMVPFINSTRAWNHPAGAHAWVEVYTDGHWTLADPSWASRLPVKGLWFGRSDGTHLAYGETAYEAQLYEVLMRWVEARGALVGAMSAPLKFAAAADATPVAAASARAEPGEAASAESVIVTPTATVRKTWDGRWGAAASAYLLLILLFAWIERRFYATPSRLADAANPQSKRAE
ncbi:MAG: transglutaminase domain-containing protein [Anaerolineae bacterium]